MVQSYRKVQTRWICSKKLSRIDVHPTTSFLVFLLLVLLLLLIGNDRIETVLLPVVTSFTTRPIYITTTTTTTTTPLVKHSTYVLRLNKDNDDSITVGDVSSRVFTPPPKKSKNIGAPSTLKKKRNKPRSKAKNLINNNNNNRAATIMNDNDSSNIATTNNPLSKISSRRASGSTGSPPPPLLVNDILNGITNDIEQHRRLYEDRTIEQDCIHFTTCSGCTIGKNIANTNVIRAAQRYFATERYDGGTIKSTTNTNNNNNNDMSSYPLAVPTLTTQWRTQAKLAVASKSKSAWSNNGCIFGLYEKGSHTVVPIPQCMVHHPSINIAIQLLEQATTRTGTVAYSSSDNNGRNDGGDLRYVQLQVERITGHVCLTLVYNAASLKECQPSLSRLVKELTMKSKQTNDRNDGTTTTNPTANSIWHSIWCHCNDSTRNNIFSRTPGRWHRLVGPEFMREPIPVATTAALSSSTASSATATTTAHTSAAGWLYFSPLTFRQGNLDGFDILALNVARAVPSGAKVCELYGGVGVLGLTTLAYHYYHQNEPLQWLRCSDENPANVRCFDRSVESLSIDMTQLDRESHRSRSKYRNTGSSTSTENEMTISELAQMMETGESYNEKAKRGNSKKVSYMVASAGKALRSGQALGANVLIVDPPRKGLEEEVLEELCKPYEPNQPFVESATMLSIPDERVNWVNDVQTLIYVSCGFDALASDCDRLLSSRSAKWTLQSTTGYILFPGSDHVETVAIFQRR